MNTTRKLSILTTLIFLTAESFCIYGALDNKYYAKTAKSIWKRDMPQFDPQADLSKPLYEGSHGIYIARYIGLDADYDMNYSASKRAHFGIDRSNAIKARYLRRNMVKLNDAEAVKDFTEFSVNVPENRTITGYTFYDIKPAFGARIIKPDGSVREIDMNEAYTLTQDGEDDIYKIAIPGLEPGDILDYFYYTESFRDELSLPEFVIPVIRSYPVRDLTIEFSVAPELAVEYGAYNGAPKGRLSREGEKNCLRINMTDIEALHDDTPHISEARQTPYYDIYVLNNLSQVEFVPSTARQGGMRVSNSVYLISDVGAAINATKTDKFLVYEAAELVKKRLKSHPEASQRMIADIAWVAMRYVAYNTKQSISDVQLALMYRQLLEELKSEYTGQIGITSPRTKAPVKDLVHFTDVNYLITAGDTCYLALADLTNLPGEIPAGYDGETAYSFPGNPSNPNLHLAATEFKLPAGQAPYNAFESVTSARTDPSDPEALLLSTDLTLTGAQKRLSKGLSTRYQKLEAVGSFFNKKPAKDKNRDTDSDNEKIRKNFEKLGKVIWDNEESRLDAYAVTEYGCTPDNPAFKARMEGKVPEAVGSAGGNLMVNIGHLNGRPAQYVGSERERKLSIVRDYPERFDNTIIFTIPEGYEVIEESIKDLNRSVSSPFATFNSEANLEDGVLTVRIIERYPRSICPPAAWNDILKVNDAANDFRNTFILLRPQTID